MPLRLTNLELPVEEPEERLRELIGARLGLSGLLSFDLARSSSVEELCHGCIGRLAEVPTERAMDSNCLLATLYHRFGIDPRDYVHDHSGSPLPILPQGEVIGCWRRCFGCEFGAETAIPGTSSQ